MRPARKSQSRSTAQPAGQLLWDNTATDWTVQVESSLLLLSCVHSIEIYHVFLFKWRIFFLTVTGGGLKREKKKRKEDGIHKFTHCVKPSPSHSRCSNLPTLPSLPPLGPQKWDASVMSSVPSERPSYVCAIQEKCVCMRR